MVTYHEKCFLYPSRIRVLAQLCGAELWLLSLGGLGRILLRFVCRGLGYRVAARVSQLPEDPGVFLQHSAVPELTVYIMGSQVSF